MGFTLGYTRGTVLHLHDARHLRTMSSHRRKPEPNNDLFWFILTTILLSIIVVLGTKL